MKQNTKTYIGLAGVFIASFFMTVLLPIPELFKGIATMPVVGALIGAIYQIFRDQAAHEKQLELLRRKQIFDLALTSHMANTAFDKHVQFCENYMKEVHETLKTLIREGSTTQALDHAKNLYAMRREYAAWITAEIGDQLGRFEELLQRIGTHAEYGEKWIGNPNESKRSGHAYLEADKLLEGLLGELLGKKSESNENLTIEKVKSQLRHILGIEELTRIREWVVSQAVKSIDKDI
jgi:hypothetical protein